MLAEERYSIILEAVERQGNVRLSDLCKQLQTSASTVRRDLTVLAERGMLTKVHGGAISLHEHFFQVEHNMEEKSGLYTMEKTAIGRYAASLAVDGDFIFLDAGTTTEKMIEFLPQKNLTFVTNGFLHAKRLAQRGFAVYMPSGRVKATTEAIVGAECVLSLQSYNFTKCFMGVNGISMTAGMSTPDKSEASVKKAAIRQGRSVFYLADHSKFDQITAITFAGVKGAQIITDRLSDTKYLTEATVKEVL